MKHVVFSVFIFPWEIDGLERILSDLKQASCFLSNDVKYTLSVTMDVSDSRINWQDSKIPKQFFIDKFENLKPLCNWCDAEFDTNQSLDCFGSAGKRRKDSVKYKDKCDLFVWLDPDMYFPMHILQVLEVAIGQISDKNYIITPELIRYWDNSWDIITNKKYLREPHNHRDYFDMYSVNQVAQELDAPYIEKIPSIKFGGGWFTCISHDLLQLSTVPDFIGPYGPDDTWLTTFALNHRPSKSCQYVMRNIVVTEIGKKYIVDNHYKKYLKLNDVDIEAHKAKIWQIFGDELKKRLIQTT
jgi:hypothetical protein